MTGPPAAATRSAEPPLDHRAGSQQAVRTGSFPERHPRHDEARPSLLITVPYCLNAIRRIQQRFEQMERGIAVIGLGYVGLPVALALARVFGPGYGGLVYGFDIS